MSIEFTDRYQALGIPEPDVNTMCKGQCEGTGVYPSPDRVNPDGSVSIDTDWTFKTCEDCGGTGKREVPHA